MSATEKKIAIVLVVILVAMIGVYVATGQTSEPSQTASAATGDAGDMPPVCAPGTEPGSYAAIQEFGEEGAKIEIVAVIPVAHGCHAATEAQLKKAYEAYPDDIHLTIVDLMGPDAAAYREKVGVAWTAVAINGSTSFRVNGRPVKLEQAENRTYTPADIKPIIEDELAKG